MSRYYVNVETPQGDFKWYLPTTEYNSITFSPRIERPTYSEFCQAVLEEWHVDLTAGAYLHVYTPIADIVDSLSSYFESIPFNLVPADGDVWKIGSMKGIWEATVSPAGTTYECHFKFSDDSSAFYIKYEYMNDTINYQRMLCPLIYSTSANKLICQNANYNLLLVNNYSPYYVGLRNSTTFSVDDALSTKANEDVIVTPEEPRDDPYDPGGSGSGYSGTGGGPAPTGGTGTTGTGGLHDDTSDPISTPSLPADVTISSGLFTAYNPNASQLADFANALWNMQPTDINDVLRFLFGGDAFNAIIGLHLLPVSPSTGGSSNIKLGNWDTGASAPKITSQYVQVPFGSLLLPEYWGNCIDYAPYTKIQLALPYIGIVDVDTDDVLGSVNTLAYNIDVLSGAICATLKCQKFNLDSVIYQWSGACAVSLPFSGASYNSVLSAIAGIAAAGMGFAAMAAGPIGAALPAAALAAGGGAFGAGSAASIMGSMKGKVQKSGSFGANSGALGIMTPYFILTRPVQSVPSTWQFDKGYPSNISAQLGTLTGYTEVSEINLECSGTEAEKKEIIDLLKKGVLF